ncbi:MAG: recombinase family protein [Oscillospiraceae bacterium]|jgi:site-specific DNA recombinase
MARSKMRKIKDVPAEAVRAALYIRVSTDRQAEEGYSIEVQTERLTAYTKTFDGDVQYELYVDDGFSGASLERPAIQRLIEDAENGRITHVIVLKLDRLSRSQKDTLHLIEDVFLPHNVAFVSVQESFNTATAFGRAVVGILSVFAQLERENIYERTRSGMQKRVEAGYWPGGGGVPFGYDYDPERGILVPNADAETVRQIYALYLQGYALQTIANMLGLKYEKLAAQILLRKTNIGIIEYNGVEYRGLHEPIVSKEVYEKAMKLHALRSAARVSTTARHLLTGLLWCGVCGARLRYQKWGKAGYKLVCYSQQISKPYLVRDPNCNNEAVWAEDVEAAVIHDLMTMTADDLGAEEDEAAVPLAETLRRKKSALETKLRRLYELYGDSGDRVLLASIEDTRTELDTLEKKLEAETARGELSKDAAAAREQLQSLRGTWPYMDEQEKRALILSVVEKITVTHGEVDIDYRF